MTDHAIPSDLSTLDARRGSTTIELSDEAETARTTAMLYRGSTIEVWTENLTTGERIRVDAVRMESRRAA